MNNFKCSTVFRQIIELLNPTDIKQLTHKYFGNWHARTYKSWDNLLILIAVHILNLNSLRELSTTLMVNEKKLYHLGLKAHKKSTISDGIRRLDYRIYEDLFYRTLHKFVKLTENYTRKFYFKNQLNLIDSTVVNTGLSMIDWGKYGKIKGAIKLHYEYDLNRDIPSFLHITPKNVNDFKAAQEHFTIKPDSIYCFDRGYNDYDWFYSFTKAGAYFVTRLKTSADYKLIGQHTPHHKLNNKNLLYDFEIKMKGYLKKPESFRLVGYIDPETGIQYQFLTNNFDIDAYTITQIYKSRWQIEIFFKWIKQNLKIKSFLGTNRNAILSQIWCAMIYFLCISFVKFQSRYKKSLFYLDKLIKSALFYRVSIIKLLNLGHNQITKLNDEIQLSLFNP